MKQISAPSHSLSAAGQDTGDSAAPDTVTDTVKQAENSDNTAEHTVTDTVKTPIELLRLFDSDGSKTRSIASGGHRTDLYLHPDELKIAEFIKKTDDVKSLQAVFRSCLRHVYRIAYSKQPNAPDIKL
jgi:hypothetical protein